MIEIGWEQYIKDCYTLKKKITCKPKTIVLVPRGGLIVGGIVAQKFPNALYICLNKPASGSSYIDLVIDDLTDTGQTLQGLEGKTAVLYWKSTSKIKPDYYARKMPDEWIKFPYEELEGRNT